MSEFLLEIFSEEVPALMQKNFAVEFKNLFDTRFEKLVIKSESFSSNTDNFSSCRILYHATGLKTAIDSKERKIMGPKVGEDASEFMAKFGIVSMNDLVVLNIKSEDYYFFIQKEDFSLVDILQKEVPLLLQKAANLFPKNMKWEENLTKWVRPIRNIFAILDKSLIEFEFAGVRSSDFIIGNKFLEFTARFRVETFDDYKKKLSDEFVMTNYHERKKKICDDIIEICTKNNLRYIDEDLNFNDSRSLLEEVTNLVDYPKILLGQVDKIHMSLPEEVIISTIKKHQKHFCLYNVSEKVGKLGNKKTSSTLSKFFIIVANYTEDKDFGMVLRGNERIIDARLRDIAFFIEEDKKIPVSERVEMLKKVVFYGELGSLHDKSKRMMNLAKFVSIWVPHANLKKAMEAARICKTDITCSVVSELPNLQGIMGEYYAKEEAFDNEICAAIREHYLPSPNGSDMPKNSIAIVLAICDRVDNILGAFLAGEIPTSSNDPYGVRRAMIGLIRIISHYRIHVPINLFFEKSLNTYPRKIYKNKPDILLQIRNFMLDRISNSEIFEKFDKRLIQSVLDKYRQPKVAIDLTDIIDKIRVISDFDQSKSEKLFTIYKRIASILKVNVNNGFSDKDKVSLILLHQKEEKILYKKLKKIESDGKAILKKKEYQKYIANLVSIDKYLNSFFDKVMINCDNNKIKHNRLVILYKISRVFDNLVDFTKLI